MSCSISGQIPEEPVVSKTGYLFEKSLIVKFVEANGKCPITGETLTLDDLVPLKINKAVKPRPALATSLPSLLQLFQNEWDALMLEAFTQKQHLETVRQELAHALYQHDAACRVIARLTKERDSARNALATAQAQLAALGETSRQTSADDMDTDKIITEEIKHKMNELSKQLSAERKKRVSPSTLAQINDIKDFTVISSHPVHKATEPGILCLDIHPKNQSLVLTGGADKTVTLFEWKDTEKKIATLSGHSKKVSGVLFHPTQDLLFSCSHDKTAKVWGPTEIPGEYQCLHTLKAHTGPVVDFSLHATNDYLVTASTDASWAFHDIATGHCLSHVMHQESKAGYTCVSFHPDGLILATGTSKNSVRIWDIKTQQNVVHFEHDGAITDLAFSENGYYLATAAEDGYVKMWDLRKLKNFQSYQFPKGTVVESLDFDYSGTYLAAGGSDISIFVAKTLEHIKTLNDHKATVTGVKFGADATFLASTSLDRHLKFFGLPYIKDTNLQRN